MSIVWYIIIFVVLYIIVSFIVDYLSKLTSNKGDKKWWERWEKDKKNFKFTWYGRELWYSRSVAVSLFLFAKDVNGNLFVLANKRGKGCPDFNGYWNSITGYLDYNRNAIDQCHIELLEETGLIINKDLIKFWSVSSDPSENKQNVSIRHIGLLENYDVENCKFDLTHMEKDEVEEARWIPIGDVANYAWAFNHDKLINEAIEYLGLK